MLFLKAIDSKTLDLLKRLQRLPELAHTRFVGGTALALQLGHRGNKCQRHNQSGNAQRLR